MQFWKHFKAKACHVKLKCTLKDEVLAAIVDDLASAGVLAEELKESAVAALQEREQLASTGIGNGVAIPHVKLPGLQSVACGLCVLAGDAEWNAVDGAPVRIVFAILRPEGATEEHDPERHLDMMRWIATLSRESDFRSFALQARTRTDLVNLLKEMSAA